MYSKSKGMTRFSMMYKIWTFRFSYTMHDIKEGKKNQYLSSSSSVHTYFTSLLSFTIVK